MAIIPELNRDSYCNRGRAASTVISANIIINIFKVIVIYILLSMWMVIIISTIICLICCWALNLRMSYEECLEMRI
jgi:hypothetical protein